ncbi:hypothetical protein D3C71_1253360 [compost metagenome]
MQLLRYRAGSQTYSLQSVLLQGEVHGWCAGSPISVDGTHHRIARQNLLHFRRNATKLIYVRTGNPIGDRKWRIGTKYKLRDPHSCLRRQAARDGLAQPHLQCLTLVLAIRTDHDLGERGVRQLRSHGQEKAGRALADVGCDNLRFFLLSKPCFHFGRRCTGLGD